MLTIIETSHDHKIPLKKQIPLFWLQKWIIQLGHVSQIANFWLSSHNFDKVAVINKFQYIQRVLYEAAMLDGMPMTKIWSQNTLVPEVFFRRKETREKEKERQEKTSGCGRCESYYHATIGVTRID